MDEEVGLVICMLASGFILLLLRQHLRRLCGKRLEEAQDAIPPYWQNAGKSLNATDPADRSSPDYFDDIYPVSLQNREILQGFLNETSSNTEIHFSLVRAVRVEHSRLWLHYQDKAARMASRKMQFKGLGPPSTNQALTNVESDGWDGGFVHAMDEEVCEAYLFHGTDPHSALKARESFSSRNLSRSLPRHTPTNADRI